MLRFIKIFYSCTIMVLWHIHCSKCNRNISSVAFQLLHFHAKHCAALCCSFSIYSCVCFEQLFWMSFFVSVFAFSIHKHSNAWNVCVSLLRSLVFLLLFTLNLLLTSNNRLTHKCDIHAIHALSFIRFPFCLAQVKYAMIAIEAGVNAKCMLTIDKLSDFF